MCGKIIKLDRIKFVQFMTRGEMRPQLGVKVEFIHRKLGNKFDKSKNSKVIVY